MEIKKSNIYKCIKWNGSMYTEEKNYLSVQDNHLIDNLEKNSQLWINNISDHFKLVKTKDLKIDMSKVEGKNCFKNQ
jgi:hypothetical protein